MKCFKCIKLDPSFLPVSLLGRFPIGLKILGWINRINKKRVLGMFYEIYEPYFCVFFCNPLTLIHFIFCSSTFHENIKLNTVLFEDEKGSPLNHSTNLAMGRDLKFIIYGIN